MLHCVAPKEQSLAPGIPARDTAITMNAYNINVDKKYKRLIELLEQINIYTILYIYNIIQI